MAKSNWLRWAPGMIQSKIQPVTMGVASPNRLPASPMRATTIQSRRLPLIAKRKSCQNDNDLAANGR